MIIDAPTTQAIAPLKMLWQQAFGDPKAFIDGFFSAGFSPARCRCVFLDGVPVGALYWFDCIWQNQRVAYLYAIATEKTCRGQGLFRKLLEDTHRHLLAHGYVGTVLVPASPDLFAMYQKFGYRPFCPMEKISVGAGKKPVSVQRITPAEYLRRRDARLSENAVLHTEQALKFFHTYGDFYAGEDLLFCAAREQDTLYFQEYLGDPAEIPGVLSALRAETGVVRLPAPGAPLAMYRSLTQTACMPDYFHIPLD